MARTEPALIRLAASSGTVPISAPSANRGQPQQVDAAPVRQHPPAEDRQRPERQRQVGDPHHPDSPISSPTSSGSQGRLAAKARSSSAPDRTASTSARATESL
ncbi:MAG: hypothetical protein U1E53_01860 [Dongiaceae bacterium]